jgi:hypothetical protein
MMTVGRQGVAPSPRGQKYEDQEIVKRPGKLVESDLYTGRKLPLGKGGQTHERQKPQDIVEKRQSNYNNDASGWVRGQGPTAGCLNPEFDHGKFDVTNRKPAKTLGGIDAKASPFSAAHKTYSE